MDPTQIKRKDCPRQAPAARTWVWPCLRALDSCLALIAPSLGSVRSFSRQDHLKAMHNPIGKSFGFARLRSQLLLPRPPQSNAQPYWQIFRDCSAPFATSPTKTTTPTQCTTNVRKSKLRPNRKIAHQEEPRWQYGGIWPNGLPNL